MQDKDTLLQPLSGPGGCGEDLSFSTEFDSIREARREDDASLAQGDWVAAIKLADWDAASDLCTELLAERSKDLRVAGWYAEAEAKLYSFAGLTHGCEVLSSLIEQYWDNIYPEAEDGDQELRIGTLTWFVTRSVELIRQAPLTKSAKGNFSLADQESARAFENAMEKDPDLRDSIPDGKPTVALISEAQRNTPKDFFRSLLADLQAARSAWDVLAAAIDARLGVDGPSFREIFDAFDAVDNHVQRVAREQGVLAGGSPVAADTTTISSGGGGAAAGFAPAAMMIGGAIQHRSQALQQLRQVADFFEQTEPHSPVTYLARKAADWGDMPLHQWLAAVVKDDSALSQLNELLGVRTEQDM
ncbi:type VI secretion system protein TssA [Chitinimonas sp. BJB300]|uniref:type VI secretion system protein TssA n=1 Tax=Chitinimonas sp. BJB300 TaxID=1559339 RepID=UPI000C0EBA1E|nr:type VI secretion system protein TssA [Chitinimonas sp. BJB300]PHV13175.1 type VI secretion system protein TssA [Chitinimonas sp. BJB300]TSJ87157.1 type VI secretion system protein TssA [Chitinimonas sp. BJB300]